MSTKITENTVKKEGFAFGKENYRLMIVGIIVIIIGNLLMIGGGSEDPTVFDPELFNFRRLTIAPVVILAGFIIEIIAIMRKPKD
jgi:membrane-bound ClpP family serine protease